MALTTETLAQAIRQQRAGNLSGAEGMVREVLRSQPNHPDALHLLGVLARQTGRAELAIESLAKALVQRTHDPAFHFKLAEALRERGQLDQAITHYRRAIELDEEFAAAHLNLGVLLEQQGRCSEALACFDRGLALRPHDAPSRLMRSLILLKQGRLQPGWREYAWRHQFGGAARRALPVPLWSGEPLEGRHLLVEAEPALCDQIMFASCYPDLVAQARQVTIVADRRLNVLWERSFPEAAIHAPGNLARRLGEANGLNRFDFRIAAGCVPRYLRSEFDDFPDRRLYLAADPRGRQLWWSRFARLGDGLKVGVSWRGRPENDSQANSTRLEQWLDVLAVPGVSFISLQIDDAAAELSEVVPDYGARIHHWPWPQGELDLDDLAARIAALDLVISVPNAIAHLAGALGVEVWNLLTASSSWRWFLERDNSPWYPSMRLFRPTAASGWEGVFQRVEHELRCKARIGDAHRIRINSNHTHPLA